MSFKRADSSVASESADIDSYAIDSLIDTLLEVSSSHILHPNFGVNTIFLIRQVMERYREMKDLHMVFIDLEKAYDKIPRNAMWWALDKHKVPMKYVGLIKDM